MIGIVFIATLTSLFAVYISIQIHMKVRKAFNRREVDIPIQKLNDQRFMPVDRALGSVTPKKLSFGKGPEKSEIKADIIERVKLAKSPDDFITALCDEWAQHQYLGLTVRDFEDIRILINYKYSELQHTKDKLIHEHLLPYLKSNFPETIMTVAWNDFIDDVNLSNDMTKTLREDIFLPWLFFTWIPYDETYAKQYKLKQPLAFYFLEKYSSQLSSYLIKLIKMIYHTHYSFYLVLNKTPEQQVKIKDIFLNKTYLVKGSCDVRCLNQGYIIFTRVLTLNGESIIVNTDPYAITPNYYSLLIEFKEYLMIENGGALTQEQLRNVFENQLRCEYLDIVSSPL